MPIGSSCLRAWLMSVVFPAPEGPETMNKVPSGWKLLDILNLLPDAFDLGFQFYNEGPEHRRARLGAHRVDFPQHFLRKEIEFFSRRLASADRAFHLLRMMRHPRQLLGDVALLHHDHRLLRDPLLADVDAGLRGDLLHALLVVGEHLAANLLAMIVEALLQITNRAKPRDDVVAQRLPFARAHRQHVREGFADDARHPLLLLLRQLGLHCFYLQ